MKIKIRDIKFQDIKKYWNQLFNINESLLILITTDKEKFNYAKSTIPDNILDIELEIKQ